MKERNRWISQRSAAEYHKTPNIYRVSFLFPLLPPPCKGGVNPRGAHKVVPLLIGVSRGEKFSILIAVYAHACAYGHRRSRHGQLNIHYCGCRLRPRNTSRTSKRNRRVAVQDLPGSVRARNRGRHRPRNSKWPIVIPDIDPMKRILDVRSLPLHCADNSASTRRYRWKFLADLLLSLWDRVVAFLIEFCSKGDCWEGNTRLDILYR